MILRGKNDDGNEVAIASGYVFVSPKRAPVREYQLRGKYILHFVLVVGANKTSEGVFRNETILCELALNAHNANMYTVCKSILPYERVDVKGTIREDKFTDKNGNEVALTVLRLDSVQFPDKAAAVILGDQQTNKRKAQTQAAISRLNAPKKEQKTYDFD